MARFFDESYDTPEEAQKAADRMGLPYQDYDITPLVYEDGEVSEKYWGIYLHKEG